MHRVIKEIKWARELSARPAGIPIGRPRGAKRQGVKYEKEFAAALPLAKHGPWFEFWDEGGHGFCQPDFLLRVGDSIVILETKYTWVEAGHSQIEQLYRPVVEAAFGCRTFGIVVCKNLTPLAPSSVPGLEEALRAAIMGKSRVVLHWLAGPLDIGSGKSRVGVSPGRVLA